MMSNAWLVKHQQHFAQLVEQQTLPHALLITGVQGSGKSELASWLSQFLLCEKKPLGAEQPCNQCKNCHLYTQESHPDARKIELQGASISVEQVRQVSKFLEQKAQLAQAQVVTIENADKLTESAANALLKTLEEPTAHSYIILQTIDAEHLLPTIVSRCQTYAIRPPVGAELSSTLQLNSQDPYSNLSHLPELSDPLLMQQFNDLRAFFINFLSSSTGRMQLIALCQNQEHSLRWLEKILVDELRQKAGWHNAHMSSDSQLKNEKLFNTTEPMWKCYLLLKAFNQKSRTLAQFNQAFGIEKLFSQMQQLIS